MAVTREAQLHNRSTPQMRVNRPISQLLLGATLFSPFSSHAAILAEDQTEVLYHSYNGGGVEITGPSLLVRKGYKDTVSVYANYYVDMVTSASIDVLTSGSPYTEERTEYSAGVDYLYGSTTLSAGYTQSEENDYLAKTGSFGVNQSFFGDLTTMSLSYSQGDDIVMQNGNETFEDEAQRKRFGLGFTQVLTKSWILGFNIESVIDQGYLNNPYRQVRYISNPNEDSSLVSFQGERYPRTRNSDAIAIRSLYYLPYRASVRLEYRKFGDSWGISADSAELRYIHPWENEWVFEAKLRQYSQTQAEFYSDLFPYIDAQEFLARDKELSEFSSLNAGLGVSYEIDSHYLSFFEKTTINLFIDYMQFDYDNFRDIRENPDAPAVLPGSEPLYSFDATVIRFFLTVAY